MFPLSPRRFHSLVLIPILVSAMYFASSSARDSQPVAVDDSYQVHGTTQIGDLLANDSDPDGDL